MEAHKHTNRLIKESSPYLLQHAHNPVDWYPWGEEAFNKARQEDKPLLVSIGYAACHWCHVMERESFENEETAEIMNNFFVNIKIDREERPDVDHIYMDAVQAMTGSGGWPLNVFLTPEGKPFYGGTYFPPQRVYNRSSWREILEAIHNAYNEKRDEIEGQANSLTEHLKSSNAFGIGGATNEEVLFSEQTLARITENILKTADKTWGGFGKAPKFPQTFSIQFLLQQYYYTSNNECLKQALLSLDRMVYGGIYDHLGGGFARYSTDEKWLAPHFEKMLYDNALLIMVLAEAFQLTQDELYKNTIFRTMDFIQRELMHENGGFYSALDADSEGVEGKFYTWSQKEIEEVLGDDAAIFCSYYDVSEKGNWEHTNILWVKRSLDEFAKQSGLNIRDLEVQLEICRAKLLQRRSTRIRPALDDKILLGWNALMNIACSKAYSATGFERYKEMAVTNAAFLNNVFTDGNGSWFHTFKNGKSKYPAFLDDLAYLINANLLLQEITGNTEYLDKAKTLTELVIKNFSEEKTGFFFYTSIEQQDVIVRKKEIYDGAIPSGNSVMAFNLNYLGIVYEKREWIERARKVCGQLGNAIEKYPTSFGNWASIFQQFVRGLPEIAITGPDAPAMLDELLKEYIPFRVLQSSTDANVNFPLLNGKSHEDDTLIYVCKNYECKAPVRNLKELKSVLK